MQSLVEQAGQIGEDIVGSLIAGIQKAGTGGTLLDVNVSPAGSTACGTASSGSGGAAASKLCFFRLRLPLGTYPRLKLRPAQKARAGGRDRGRS
ncbi:MAG: hypothetical protein ACLUO5_02775 [Ruminococcus sp.]